jgi:hypothetical protein
MTVPSGLPDGTVVYTSPVYDIDITCSIASNYAIVPIPIVLTTTADFVKFAALRNGLTTTVYVDGVAFANIIKTANISGFPVGPIINPLSKTLHVYIQITTDKAKGDIPVQGTLLSGGFESIYIMSGGISFVNPRGVISLLTPQITYIPCQMSMVINPDAITFDAILLRDIADGKAFRKPFSIVIHKSEGCSFSASVPFGINLWFDSNGQALNADGSLDLGNGTGLTIRDSSSAVIPYNSLYKINDVTVDSQLINNFTASVQNVPGKGIKTGVFDASLVVRMNYF